MSAGAGQDGMSAGAGLVAVDSLRSGDAFMWCGRRVVLHEIEPDVKKYRTPYQRLGRTLTVVEPPATIRNLRYFDNEEVERA